MDKQNFKLESGEMKQKRDRERRQIKAVGPKANCYEMEDVRIW
jgi:hypothetical protein